MNLVQNGGVVVDLDPPSSPSGTMEDKMEDPPSPPRGFWRTSKAGKQASMEA